MQPVPELLAAFEEGRAAFPVLSLGYDAFAARVAQNDVALGDLAAHARDFYLATSCALADPAALRIFEQRFIRTLDAHLARSPEWQRDVQQGVRLKLLLGTEPGIGRYRAQGPLFALVRVTAVRVAVDVATSAAALKKHADDEVLNLLVSMDAGPEIDAARSLYRDRFRAAVEQTLDSLSGREKTILRLHFVDGLNIEGIGAIYRVHRATVARWLVAIRARVVSELRKRLSLHLGGTPSELRSLIALLREDLEVSARRILGQAG